jgi:hypothetical protein
MVDQSCRAMSRTGCSNSAVAKAGQSKVWGCGGRKQEAGWWECSELLEDFPLLEVEIFLSD